MIQNVYHMRAGKQVNAAVTKILVQFKIKILASFTHPHIVPDPYAKEDI